MKMNLIVRVFFEQCINLSNQMHSIML